MTARHDQPPLSRRQVRESAPTETDESPIDDDAAGETPPRRSAGRRVQWDPSAETAAPGAVPQTTTYDVADERANENPAYRVRDYRPDIRRASFTPLMTADPQDPWSPPADASGTIGVAERATLPTELAAPEYTMTRRALRELRQRAEAAGQEAPNVVRDANGSLTLTGSIPVIDLPRDDDGHISEQPLAEAPATAGAGVGPELDGANASPTEEQAEDEPAAAHQHEHIPVDVIVAEQALAAAIIDDVTVSDATIVEVDGAAAPHGRDGAADFDDFDGDTLISPPARINAPSVDTIHALIEPDAEAPEQFEAQAGTQTEPETLSPFDALFLPPSSGASPAAALPSLPPLLEHEGGRGVEPAPDAAPYGHWSTQAALDDASQSNEAMLSRNVAFTTGAITTHALVLPSASSSSDHLLNPVTATGEIMVTGSVDLPRSFGTTGAHPALFDHPDVDALIDESDREDAVSESAPVRAIRAVSSSSSTRGVIEAPSPRKSRLPLIAGITGGSALLVAAGVVAAGFIFNVF